ncbi:MAG TPA: hypothetical protein VLJ61_06695 [Pyrinomonadaceae bacterium]|nr:hypothetical protein [Pyrinomonadaceae bacterium]
MVILARFVKIMIFTAFLAVLGPVLIFAVIMLASPGAHLSADVSREELVSKLSSAFAIWFGAMFFIGFI